MLETIAYLSNALETGFKKIDRLCHGVWLSMTHFGTSAALWRVVQRMDCFSAEIGPARLRHGVRNFQLVGRKTPYKGPAFPILICSFFFKLLLLDMTNSNSNQERVSDPVTKYLFFLLLTSVFPLSPSKPVESALTCHTM